MHRRNRSNIPQEFTALRHSLRLLDRSIRRLAPKLSAALSLKGSRKENGRSRPRLSAKARASLVLQGRYIGYIRHLKPRQKAQVRKIRETKGVRAAIARARGLSQSNNR